MYFKHLYIIYGGLSEIKTLLLLLLYYYKNCPGFTQKKCRNSPLLAALGIEKIKQLIKRQQLSLLRNSLISNSKARTFYIRTMRTHHWRIEGGGQGGLPPP